MALFTKKKKKKQEEIVIEPIVRGYKQCPECMAKLPLDAKKCAECGQRVGRALPDGKARKPIDWKAYILALLCIWMFILYFRWAFLSE